MNRLLTLTCLVTAASLSHAEELPHLDFVRNLRRTYPDLALEYLTRLSKAPPASLAKQLPLELARTRLDIATTTPDVEQRLELYRAARLELEDFLDKNKNDPLGPTVELDVARVLVLQGRTQLGRALSEETTAAMQAEAEKARKLLAEGGGRLGKVRDAIDKQLDKLDNPTTDDGKRQKKELEEARLQCQMEEAMSLLDQRRTFLDEREASLRAQNALAKKATDLLTKLANEGKGAVSFEASAWLITCYYLNDLVADAYERYNRVMNDSSPVAASGKRLARYLVLQIFEREVLPAGILKPNENKLTVIRTRATDWMRDYPAHLKTPEGYGVQYTLAKTLWTLSGQMGVGAAEKKQMFDQAKALCRTIERGESEFTRDARKLKLGIMFQEKAFDRKIESLTTFDDAFVRAQYEASQMEEDAKKLKDKPDDLKKQRDVRFQSITAALNQAMKLTDKNPKPPEKDVLNARATLAYAYMTMGGKDNQAKAIAAGEELAAIKTRPPESAKGAIYALQSLTQILSEGERSGYGPDELKKFRDRFVALAELMKKGWPNDTAGDVARHQLGLLYIRDSNFPLAAKELFGIQPGYAGAIHSSYQMAMAALAADQAGAKTAEGDPDNRPFKERAQAALELMPELPADADDGTNYTYLLAKIKLGQILYVAKKYDELEKMAKPLKERVNKMSPGDLPSAEAHEEMKTGFATLMLYALFGKADAAFKAGKLADVNAILDPVISQALKDEAPELRKNAQLRWGLLGLALRSAIQDNKLDKANSVIQAIQKLSSGEETTESETQTLLQLSQLINEQMRELKKKNQPEATAKAQGGFAQLLDGMLKQRKDQLKDKPQLAYVLAKCYGSLGTHKQAAELLKDVAEPKAGADQQAVGLYQTSRVEYVRQLRLDKKLDDAQKELDAIKTTDWGKKNLDVMKEAVYITQDRDLHGKAANDWDKLIKQLLPLIERPGMKGQYFECFYNLTYCVARSAEKQTDAAVKARLTKQAAGFLVNLEKTYPDRGGDEWNARYQDMLDTMPDVKKEYDTLKAAAPK